MKPLAGRCDAPSADQFDSLELMSGADEPRHRCTLDLDLRREQPATDIACELVGEERIHVRGRGCVHDHDSHIAIHRPLSA